VEQKGSGDGQTRVSAAGRLDKFRGSPVKRTKRSGLRRNALIAIGNSGDKRLIPVVDRALHDSDPAVCEAARWAKTRLLQA
jgi:epoxyqueuosine reductase